MQDELIIKYIKKKKEMKFQSQDALKTVQSVINEANEALNDKTRTIAKSAIPEVLAGALGVGAGGALSFAALLWDLVLLELQVD